MRFLPHLTALLLLLLLSSGIASASVGNAAPDLSSETDAITNQVSTPITFSGSNDQVTSQFSWGAGLMIVRWTADDGLLIVHLIDTNGEIVEYLISQYNAGPGSSVVNVPKAGTYMLDVDSDTPYSITLSNTLYSTQSTAWSGTNDMATYAFYCNAGRLDVAWTAGDGLIIVHLVDTNGEIAEYLISQYNEGPGSTAVNVRRAGYYMLDVDADTPWSITLSGAIQPASAPPTSLSTTPPTLAPVYIPPTQPPVVVTTLPTPQSTQSPVIWSTNVGQAFVLSSTAIYVSSGLPVVGGLITLQERPQNGAWTEVGSTRTDESGRYSFTLEKSVAGVYEYRSASNGQVLGGGWVVTVVSGSTTVPTTVAPLLPIAQPVVQPVVTLKPSSGWGKRYTVGDPGTYLGTRAGSSTAPTGTSGRRVAATTGTVLKPGSTSYGITPPASGSFVRWYPAARWQAGIK
ncbi:MAG: hypothetical protein ABFC38_12020 [Methanospirillum sp.]